MDESTPPDKPVMTRALVTDMGRTELDGMSPYFTLLTGSVPCRIE